MLNDKDLAALIRMADEVDRLESPAASRFEWAAVQASGRSALIRRMTLGMGGLAAAACVGLGMFLWAKPATVPQQISRTNPAPVLTLPTPTDVESTPVTVAVGKAPQPVLVTQAPIEPEIQSVVMAVFQDADDRCSCIQMNPGNFKGDLANVGSQELLRTAMANACHANPDRVLVIAMQGPSESLPTSTAEAEVWAACVSERTGHCDGDSFCVTRSSAPFIPAGVTMITGSMAFTN